MATTGQPNRTQTFDEIKPLVELCKSGKLFEVQAWISAGNPVNPPPPPAKGNRRRSPLEIAIDRGFHSLVKVLLDGGAIGDTEDCDCPLYQALEMRRLDLISLLVEHGFDAKSVDMVSVFRSWDPEIMEYFIERGADVDTGNPLAHALCERIQTALRILKRYRSRFASFQEQANIALRHHCKEGNLKWTSLMLWGGADPNSPGVTDPGEERDIDDEGLTAVGWAALYGHYDVLKLKKIKLSPNGRAAHEVLKYSCDGRGLEFVEKLLLKGIDPNDQEDGGCSIIQKLLEQMSWNFSAYRWSWNREQKHIDTDESREKIKALHLLVKHGARWIPRDRYEMNAARRSLLKLTPDYTIEFVWIMAKFHACAEESIQTLLRTPTIKSHISGHRERVGELLASWV